MNTERKREKLFKETIKHGRIYPCISCHRFLFKNGVYKFIIEDFDEAIICQTVGEDAITDSSYVCYTCKGYLTKKKMPPMCYMNNLQLFDISNFEELHLTELENAMIALNILFQKVFKLPKSRWPAMKDKTVNIPIYETDVIRTIESLPRTPNSAGIIPVELKRRLNFRNYHMTQYVSVPKLETALQTLKSLGHQYYQFQLETEEFLDTCKERDIEGFNFLYPGDELLSDDAKQEAAAQAQNLFPLVTPEDEIDLSEPNNDKGDNADNSDDDDDNKRQIPLKSGSLCTIDLLASLIITRK